MKKRLLTIIVLFLVMLCLSTWSFLKPPSTFSIQFIDVGQGDAALVECDGRYMLIDGGDVKAGDKVYSVLEEKGIQHLDILVLSHLHADHIGGLTKALTYASKIDKVMANSSYGGTEIFRKVEHELDINGVQITVPHMGDKYQFGSAEIEVVDVAATLENDSLVLMITYGKTRFLFTGDIEDEVQTRISDRYENEKDEAYKIDLIKMPHHGSASPKTVNGTGSLYRFIRTFMPDYAVISVGKDNKYGHPHKETLDLLKDAHVKVYRTDTDGNITIRSDGESLSIDTSK
ncbi:MAG: MBL fold metallo-hydrolase [Hungatella sp.]|nr:MBL fold metallo-hydrolase [Hungatella sp.]